jgi:hypothetical protein
LLLLVKLDVSVACLSLLSLDLLGNEFQKLLSVLHDDWSHVRTAGVPQLIESLREVLPNLEENMIRHHIPDRFILLPSDEISPLEKSLQDAELCDRLQSLVSSYDHKVVEVFDLRLFIDFESKCVTFMVYRAEELMRV